MNIRTISRIHELIKLEQTGMPKEFALKIGISERSIYNYITYMKTEMKAPIVYDAAKESYCYDGDCGFCFEGR